MHPSEKAIKGLLFSLFSLSFFGSSKRKNWKWK
jgi:hypothetical protein